MDSEAILQGLNAAQRSAVTAEAAVVQILAPPGSGKTKTLTSRVAYLLARFGYQPWNVLCLTFTIKSAREMKARIAKLTGNGLEAKLVLGTFHSVCRRYLVRYGHLIGLRRGFGIADSTDSLNAIKRIIKRLKLTVNPSSARGRISKAKARASGYDQLRSDAAKKPAALGQQQEFLLVFDEYEAHLATCNLLDYDDLLLRCVELLRRHPECVSNVEAVLVDEFQDTNSVQFDLMELFAAARQRVTTVGDPDQSIYGWRSAEVKNLLKMQELYPDTLVLNLEDNYRSSAAILSASLEVIEQDESRPPKPLQPTHCRGTRPAFRKLPSAWEEAAWLVSEIKRCIKLTGDVLNPSDFAILLRSAALSRNIESSLGKAGLPYRMVGGARFFDRIEVKLLLNYLRVVSHPSNNEAFSAIINVPSRRIGENSIKSLVEEARSKGMSLFDFCHGVTQGRVSKTTKMLKAAEHGLGDLVSMVLTARKKFAEDVSFYPDQVLHFVMEHLDFQEYLKKTHPDDHESRWSNVEELIAQAADPSFAKDPAEEDDVLPSIDGVEQAAPTSRSEEVLSKFLANVALSTELQRDDEAEGTAPQERITISTIHAAKGLEWPVVFVPSAYQGSIPHSRAEDYDEERRLLYVAMTRAQALLYISWPLENALSGDSNSESEFLPPKLVARHFSDKGPALDLVDVEGVAQILGREVPSEETLTSARLDAENVEDDLWPTSGSGRRAWYARGGDDSESRYDVSGKRPKLGGGLMAHQASYMSSAARASYQQAQVAGLPVQQRFILASDHLRTHRTTMDSLKHEKGSYTASKNKPEAVTNLPDAKNSLGKLSSFWEPVKNRDADPAGRAEPPLAHAPTKTQGSGSYEKPIDLTDGPHSSTPAPVAGLPPMASRHSVSREGSSRPKVESEPNTGAPWVFLSSSSPPPEPHRQPDRNRAQPDAAHSHEQAATRPSVTLHNTSMQALNGAGSRRTLGVKRGVGSWGSGGVMRPFIPPTMSGAKSARREAGGPARQDADRRPHP